VGLPDADGHRLNGGPAQPFPMILRRCWGRLSLGSRSTGTLSSFLDERMASRVFLLIVPSAGSESNPSRLRSVWVSVMRATSAVSLRPAGEAATGGGGEDAASEGTVAALAGAGVSGVAELSFANAEVRRGYEIFRAMKWDTRRFTLARASSIKCEAI